MNPTLECILKTLSQYLIKNGQNIPDLVCPGNRFEGWSDSRLKQINQLVINAYTAPSNEYSDLVSYRQSEILKELDGKVLVEKIIPFPFDDIDEMRNRLKELSDHYGGAFEPDSILTQYGKGGRMERGGYIIITVVNIRFVV